jgi:hypothetical protein
MAINQYPPTPEGPDKNINYVINQGGTYTVNVPAGVYNAETNSTYNITIGSTTLSGSTPAGRKLFIPLATTTTINVDFVTSVTTWPAGLDRQLRSPNLANNKIVKNAYGNGLYAALGHNSFNIRRSTDTQTWTTVTPPQTSTGFSVTAYGNGVFYVGTSIGTSTRNFTSTNLVTFTVNTINNDGVNSTGGFPVLEFLRDVFFIFNRGASSNIFSVATNANNWAQGRTLPTSSPYDETYNSLRDEFMFSFSTGSGSGILAFSQNTIDWTTRTAPFGANASRGTGFANNLYLLGGTTNRIAVSTDGTLWTQRSISGTGITGEIKGFETADGITMAYSTTGQVIVSTDTISWSPALKTNVLDRETNGIKFANNMFIASSNDGFLTVLPKVNYDAIRPTIVSSSTLPESVYLSLEYKGNITQLS